MLPVTFEKTINDYYRKNGRDLLWRNTRDPYAIFISEVMLQQTQVVRVLKKYTEFLNAFPTFRALSKASLKDVLIVWQGMGYNRRAKYLKQSAEIITKKYKGILPRDIEAVDSLPGIGYATAGSILCFSYNIPTVFIETNVRRVFIHFFFKDRQGVDDKDIYPLIEKTIDRKNPREWYYALMDYGSFLGGLKDNPNRKSKHHVVQSRFDGSDRKIRGIVIRELLLTPLNLPTLLMKIKTEKKRLVSILNQMKKEELVQYKNGLYFIK